MNKTLIWIILWLWLWVSGTLLANYLWNYSIDWKVTTLSVDEKKWINDLKKQLDTIQGSEVAKFKQILEVLEKWYLWNGTIDSKKMVDWALHWYVDAINDPFTTYLDKVQSYWLNEELKWSQDFEWIGAVVSKKTDWIQVVEVIKSSPAHLAWVRPLDFIIEIDWKKTTSMDLVSATKMIRGTKWSSVEITIYRPSEKQIIKRKVVRDKITVPSVVTNVLEVGSWKANVWYVNVSIFWDDTTTMFKKWLTELFSQWTTDKPTKWLIIDLRWNWGWYLVGAIDMASMLIPRNTLITSTRYKLYPQERYESQWDDIIGFRPIIVLVDWLTASASEVLAGALKFHKNAILVWSKTFWKWSIQTINDFGDWSSIKYTIWKRDLPDWSNIDWVWIKPDIEIEFDEELYLKKWIDNQLEKAKEIISSKIK